MKLIVWPSSEASSTTVRTASPERTFWEKATILHQEANRPVGKAMLRRYSRHYYDARLRLKERPIRRKGASISYESTMRSATSHLRGRDVRRT